MQRIGRLPSAHLLGVPKDFWPMIEYKIHAVKGVSMSMKPEANLLHITPLSLCNYKRSCLKELLTVITSYMPLKWKQKSPTIEAQWLAVANDIKKATSHGYHTGPRGALMVGEDVLAQAGRLFKDQGISG